MKAEIINFLEPNTKKIIIAFILILLSFLITFNVTSPPSPKGQFSRPITGIPLTYFTATPTQISAPAMTTEPPETQWFDGCNFQFCRFIFASGNPQQESKIFVYYSNAIINIIFWYIISALILMIYTKIKK
jgi:hypothetical protein